MPIVRLYDFVAGDVIRSAEVDQELNQLVAQINTLLDRGPIGAAGGDLSGSYPNPGVARASFETAGSTVATAPGDYASKARFRWKEATAIGAGTAGYVTLLGWRGWGDDSGGQAHEMAFLENGTIWNRSGTTSGGWGAWQALVRGNDTRLTNQRAPLGPETNLKTIRGNVNADGTIAAPVSGAGFTVTKGTAGVYTINFSTAFSGPPTVTLAVVPTGGSGVQAVLGGGVHPAAGSVAVETFNSSAYANYPFSFTATGPA